MDFRILSTLFPHFLFTYPASPKCAEEPENPTLKTCALQSIYYDTVLNSHRKKSPANCKINTSSPIVKPSCLSAAWSVQEESGSPAPSLHELSSARAGAQPWHWVTGRAIPGKQKFHLFISQEIWTFFYFCSLTARSFLSFPKPA